MNVYNKLKRIEEIYDKLQDEESKRIFEARLSLAFSCEGRIEFWKKIKGNKKWYMPYDLDCECIIFGAGKMGQHIYELLSMAGKKVCFFVDNDGSKVGKTIGNIVIRGVDELLKYPKLKVVISNRIYEREIREQFKKLGIKNEIVQEECIYMNTGKQYFDVFEPGDDEVFIEAGAYDGATIKDFIEWMGEKRYKHIYSFEPDLYYYKKTLDTIKDTDRISFINKGLYDEEKKLCFDNCGNGASKIDVGGENSKIEVTTIDRVVKGEKVTYIKLDVEGSEKAALIGGKETIMLHKPKLAICVYHKNFDIIELPLLILDYNKDYKFYLRHYCSNLCETVLYAE